MRIAPISSTNVKFGAVVNSMNSIGKRVALNEVSSIDTRDIEKENFSGTNPVFFTRTDGWVKITPTSQSNVFEDDYRKIKDTSRCVTTLVQRIERVAEPKSL